MGCRSREETESLGSWGPPEPQWGAKSPWPQMGLPKAEQNSLPPLGLYNLADPAAGDLGCRGSFYLLVSWWHGPGTFQG